MAQLRLRIIQPGKPTRIKSFRKDVVFVGRTRSEENDLDFEDDSGVSGYQHMRFFITNGSLFAEDLDSTNGTYVNEKQLKAPVSIRPGDVVQVSSVKFEVLDFDAEQAAPDRDPLPTRVVSEPRLVGDSLPELVLSDAKPTLASAGGTSPPAVVPSIIAPNGDKDAPALVAPRTAHRAQHVRAPSSPSPKKAQEAVSTGIRHIDTLLEARGLRRLVARSTSGITATFADGSTKEFQSPFATDDEVCAFVERIAEVSPSPTRPVVEVTLTTGYIRAIHRSSCNRGTLVVVERPAQGVPASLDGLVQRGILPLAPAHLLKACCRLGLGVCVIGVDGSSLFELGVALLEQESSGPSAIIRGDWAPAPTPRGCNVFDALGDPNRLIALLRASSSLQPSRILLHTPLGLELDKFLDNVRRRENRLVLSMTGADMTAALQSLCRPEGELSASGSQIPRRVGATLNIVVLVSRSSSGSPRIERVTELVFERPADYVFYDVFKRDRKGEKLEFRGLSGSMQRLVKSRGFSLDQGVLGA